MLLIELVHSPIAGRVERLELLLTQGTTLGDALRQSGTLDAAQLADLAALKVGIWGRLAPLDTELRDRDRIEIYRPLTVDPKEARRQRYRNPEDKSKRVRPKPRR